jgi:hypothetical protein
MLPELRRRARRSPAPAGIEARALSSIDAPHREGVELLGRSAF